MTKIIVNVDRAKMQAAAKRAMDFWGSIDGAKLAKLGQKDSEMDIVGPLKGELPARQR